MLATNRSSAPPLRCAAVWATTTGVAAALVAALVPAVASAHAAPAGTGLSAQPFDRVLVWVCATVALGATVVLWAMTTAVTLEALSGHTARVPGVPCPLRRLVLAACGLAVVAGLSTPAHAAPGEVHRDRTPQTAAVVIAGLPLPDRAVAAPPGGPRTGAGPSCRSSDASAVVEVQPGDTLWELARRDLGPSADDAAITARWHEIYELNRAAIGADPDLIQPAQRLRLPTG